MPLTVKPGQSLVDLALQTSGHHEAAWALAVLNGMSITDVPKSGDVLQTSPVLNGTVVALFRANGVEPASWVDPQGISYWIIGSTFQVYGEEVQGISFWVIGATFQVS